MCLGMVAMISGSKKHNLMIHTVFRTEEENGKGRDLLLSRK